MDVKTFVDHDFTHLIIGGGTAGLAVAARLSENPKTIVGILEAGPAAFDEPLINIPSNLGASIGSKYDWNFETIPQAELNGRKVHWSRGKVLGGSSCLHFMAWMRGARGDYDTWETLGNSGWSWNGLLPFFKKSETFHPPDDSHKDIYRSHYDASFHGTNGPIQTTHSSAYGAAHDKWHDTLAQYAINTNRSHFSGSNVGVFTGIASVDKERGQRSYSATAYYKPNMERKNMVLLTDALVRDIVLEEATSGEWTAKGVRFIHGGTEHVARVTSEVVLCAGAIQSPQLLELSGVGDPEVLNAAGIEVKVANLNVGTGLQDHNMALSVFEIDPSISTSEDLRADVTLAEAADKQYAESCSGPRTMVPWTMAYMPLSHFMSRSTLESLASKLPSTSSHVFDRVLHKRLLSDEGVGQMEWIFDVSNYSPFFKSVPGKKYATLFQMLQYPFSRGTVHIAPMTAEGGIPTTSDTSPIIDPKVFQGAGGQIDLEIMTEALQYANKICATEPLAEIIQKRVYPPEDQSLKDWIREATMTCWHPIGTCAMGGDEGSDGGVVDERLRVYGVRGLRVVDASIMPLQISAHLQATVYAIAEKAAAMILEDFVTS